MIFAVGLLVGKHTGFGTFRFVTQQNG